MLVQLVTGGFSYVINRKIRFQIGTNNWDLETCKKS